MNKQEEKSLESLEKIYLKNKYPRLPDSNFNRLDLKSSDLQKVSNIMEAQKILENSNNLEENDGFELIKSEEHQQNFESMSLINSDKMGNTENTEEINDEALASDKYSTPLIKLKNKFIFFKYISLILNISILAYLAYHMLNLIKLKFFYKEEEQSARVINEYYQKNSDNMVFSNNIVTIILYLTGIITYTYNLIIHMQFAMKNIKFYENDYLLNQKNEEKCKRSRQFCLVFAIIFCLGNFFQIVNFNYSKEFDSLANNGNENDGVNNEEDERIMNSWRVYFYVLVIAAIFIKVAMFFLSIELWKYLVKFKFEYSKMYFEFKNSAMV